MIFHDNGQVQEESLWSQVWWDERSAPSFTAVWAVKTEGRLACQHLCEGKYRKGEGGEEVCPPGTGYHSPPLLPRVLEPKDCPEGWVLL